MYRASTLEADAVRGPFTPLIANAASIRVSGEIRLANLRRSRSFGITTLERSGLRASGWSSAVTFPELHSDLRSNEAS